MYDMSTLTLLKIISDITTIWSQSGNISSEWILSLIYD